MADVALSPDRNRKRWTSAEDECVRLDYPDYQAMLLALHGRSHRPLRARARDLGIQSQRTRWTTIDVRLLQTMRLAGATFEEIALALPGRSASVIVCYCKHMGFRAPRPNITMKSQNAVVKREAQRRGFNARQLDQLARTGRYFWGGQRHDVMRHVAAGAKALGGWVDVDWESLD